MLGLTHSYQRSSLDVVGIFFLDWETAFDRIKQDLSWVVLQRPGIREHFIDMVQDAYSKVSFFVENEVGISQTKKQRAGIRQGCALSPRFFECGMCF